MGVMLLVEKWDKRGKCGRWVNNVNWVNGGQISSVRPYIKLLMPLLNAPWLRAAQPIPLPFLEYLRKHTSNWLETNSTDLISTRCIEWYIFLNFLYCP